MLLQILHGEVSDGPRSVAPAVLAATPTSMSWSNIPDYMSPRDFHKLAAACAGDRTVHFLHTMNWPYDVIGGTIVDYRGHPRLSSAQRDALRKERLALREDGVRIAGETLRRRKAARFLRDRPLDNVRNFADQKLWTATCERWAEAWAAEAAKAGLAAHLSIDRRPAYDGLSRANSTMYLRLTYEWA